MFKKIINTFFGYIKKQNLDQTIPKDFIAYEDLINSNNLKIGNNTDISDLKINIFGKIPNKKNIEIGDDCLLHGSIVIYSSDAKIKIGNRVFIGPNTTIFCYKDINIEDDVMISWGCTLIDTNAHSLSSKERINDVQDWKKGWQHKNWDVVASKNIVIKSNSWIGFNSIITKGVILEKGCIVASGSVVTKSFNEYSILGGNPARFIKKTS